MKSMNIFKLLFVIWKTFVFFTIIPIIKLYSTNLEIILVNRTTSFLELLAEKQTLNSDLFLFYICSCSMNNFLFKHCLFYNKKYPSSKHLFEGIFLFMWYINYANLLFI